MPKIARMSSRAMSVGALLLLALPARAQAAPDLELRVNAALERARDALRHHLRREDDSRLALVCLAAAHDGLDMEDRTFRAAVSRLVRAKIRDTYGLSLRLMVAAHVADLPNRAGLARRDLGRLLEHQSSDGGFGYHPSPATWDLSNTQYAALGLRAAAHLQQRVPAESWDKLLRRTLEHQREDGGFAYSGKMSPTVSMTVAGIAIVEICRRHLELDAELQAWSARAAASGWRWVELQEKRMFGLESAHSLYAFYGIERAAVLSRVDTIGDVDWFACGAEAILPLQRRDGGFVALQHRSANERRSRGGSAIDTAFAVLFLRRSFRADLGAPTDGPVTPGPSRGCRELAADADEAGVRAAVAYELARGRTAIPDLLAAMRRGHEPARRAAALALMRLSGEDFGYHPARTAEQNAEALRRAERWWLANRAR
jgi:hypothetical protein